MLGARKILLLLVATVLSMSAVAQDGKKPNAKPTLYIFSAQWCAPCQRMHKEALDDSEVRVMLQRMEYYLVDLDTTKDGKAIYRKHARTGGVPELVLYDNQGKLIARQAGYETVEGMIKFMRQAFSAKELEEIARQKALHELRYVDFEDNE